MIVHLTQDFEALEIKSESDDLGVVKGYASTWGNADQAGDVIQANAFGNPNAKSIPLLWNHNMDQPIGGLRSIKNDDKGLLVVTELNLKVVKGAEAYELAKAGHLKGFSVGFRPDRKSTIVRDDYSRLFQKAELIELSMTPLPCNRQAQFTEVKSLMNNETDLLQEMCASLGWPASDVKALLDGGLVGLKKKLLAGSKDHATDVDEEELKKALQSFVTTFNR